MEKRVEQIGGGLQCDSPTCDWRDDNIKVEEYESYLNAECPKCGENILTEEDYFNVIQLMGIIDFVNSLTDEEMENFKNHPDFKSLDLGLSDEEGEVTMIINTHKGLTIESIEVSDKKDD